MSLLCVCENVDLRTVSPQCSYIRELSLIFSKRAESGNIWQCFHKLPPHLSKRYKSWYQPYVGEQDGTTSLGSVE